MPEGDFHPSDYAHSQAHDSRFRGNDGSGNYQRGVRQSALVYYLSDRTCHKNSRLKSSSAASRTFSTLRVSRHFISEHSFMCSPHGEQG